MIGGIIALVMQGLYGVLQGNVVLNCLGALLLAKDDLREGRVPGALTGLRLVEIAGVKGHRLTHGNPDINGEFQRRARELNRSKPEVESLRAQLLAERNETSGSSPNAMSLISASKPSRRRCWP